MTTVASEAEAGPPADESMSEVLALELAQWQELGRQALELFPYAEETV